MRAFFRGLALGPPGQPSGKGLLPELGVVTQPGCFQKSSLGRSCLVESYCECLVCLCMRALVQAHIHVYTEFRAMS